MMRKKKISLTAIGMLLCILIAAGCSGNGGAEDRSEREESTAAAKEIKTENVGAWLKTKKKAQADGKEHEVKFRVKSIVTKEADVKKVIEKYNVSGANEVIDLDIGNDDLAYCVANYEVSFPEEYPDEDYGLTNVAMKFEVKAADGSDEIKYNGTIYPNLTDTIEIGSLPQGYDFYSGQTYSGSVAYVIPKGCTDYLLKAGKYYIKPDGE